MTKKLGIRIDLRKSNMIQEDEDENKGVEIN